MTVTWWHAAAATGCVPLTSELLLIYAQLQRWRRSSSSSQLLPTRDGTVAVGGQIHSHALVLVVLVGNHLVRGNVLAERLGRVQSLLILKRLQAYRVSWQS